MTNIGKNIIFLWVPSHVGIWGNTVVDEEAKNALNDPISNMTVPFTDFKSLILKYIKTLWQAEWDLQTNNKLHEIVGEVGHNYIFGKTRRDQVVLTRCRIGHTRTTHSYLLENESPPECIPCQCRQSIRHILVDCVDKSDIIRRYYTVNNIKELFTCVAGDNLLKYLKDVGLYSRI